ncbi:putative mitochondrial protein [Andalucia godoyi]|uniref:Putative mitochondrial protein n=1 Tax=Andalucia godoyi TaxID=505711 RepID=A0A8K0AHT6_ANDGO|nr:putative mitochondrial protein [Andalucia godoyi]|eukprot:ANDGO_07211.mRNA.1 putative mitochondrial protein
MRGTLTSISSKAVTQRLHRLLKSSSFEQKPAKRWMNSQFIASVQDFYETHLVFPEVARCLRERTPAFYRGKMKFMCDIYVWMGVIEYFVVKHFAASFYFTLVQRSGIEEEAKIDEFTKKLEDEMRCTDGILAPLRQFRNNIIEDVELMMQSLQRVCQDRLLKFQDLSQEDLKFEW